MESLEILLSLYGIKITNYNYVAFWMELWDRKDLRLKRHTAA